LKCTNPQPATGSKFGTTGRKTKKKKKKNFDGARRRRKKKEGGGAVGPWRFKKHNPRSSSGDDMGLSRKQNGGEKP